MLTLYLPPALALPLFSRGEDKEYCKAAEVRTQRDNLKKRFRDLHLEALTDPHRRP
ncbi:MULTISPECIES: hypothetical protein [Stenotrophomonas]|uniref:hypothetical protein n=1 Tax=Stenotrophomonas TaxID=40323 RepID=UPI00209684E0|nr:hypothetical protein [Stenotrophomonas maltophilia]MCO7462659.1 hypothetical protein [Stenotrophomonas maltophilia]